MQMLKQFQFVSAAERALEASRNFKFPRRHCCCYVAKTKKN